MANSVRLGKSGCLHNRGGVQDAQSGCDCCLDKSLVQSTGSWKDHSHQKRPRQEVANPLRVEARANLPSGQAALQYQSCRTPTWKEETIIERLAQFLVGAKRRHEARQTAPHQGVREEGQLIILYSEQIRFESSGVKSLFQPNSVLREEQLYNEVGDVSVASVEGRPSSAGTLDQSVDTELLEASLQQDHAGGFEQSSIKVGAHGAPCSFAHYGTYCNVWEWVLRRMDLTARRWAWATPPTVADGSHR